MILITDTHLSTEQIHAGLILLRGNRMSLFIIAWETGCAKTWAAVSGEPLPPPRITPTVARMPRNLDTARPRAGTRTIALALLAVAGLLLSPLAAGVHHHGSGTRPGDDTGCSACLWQSQHVASLVTVPAPAPAPATLLAARVAHLHLLHADLPRPAARAPPALHA